MAVKFLGKQYGLNDVRFGFFLLFLKMQIKPNSSFWQMQGKLNLSEYCLKGTTRVLLIYANCCSIPECLVIVHLHNIPK